MVSDVLGVPRVVGGVVIGFVVLVGVDMLSKYISASIQEKYETGYVLGERVDNSISLIVVGLLLAVLGILFVSDVTVLMERELTMPTIAVIIGSGSVILGMAEFIFLIKYKIPEFKNKYNNINNTRE